MRLPLLLISALALIASLSFAESTEMASRTDITTQWSYTAAGDITTINTNTCMSTTVTVTDTTDASTVIFKSCTTSTTPDSDCAGAGAIDGVTSPTATTILHGAEWLRMEVKTGPDSGTSTVDVVCRREGWLRDAELDQALSQANISRGLGGSTWVEADSANERLPWPTFDNVASRSDLVHRAGLHSDTTTVDGIGLEGQWWGGTHASFNSEGANFNDSYGMFWQLDNETDFPGLDEIALLDRGTIGMTLSEEYTYDGVQSPTSHTYFLSNTKRGWLRLNSGGYIEDSWVDGVVNEGEAILPSTVGKESGFDIILTWNTEYREVYVNRLLVLRIDRKVTATDDTQMQDLTFGNDHWSVNSATQHDIDDERISNVFLLESYVRTPPRRDEVLFVGDSLVTGGCRAQTLASGIPAGDSVRVTWAPRSHDPRTGAEVAGNTKYGCGFDGSGDHYSYQPNNWDASVDSTFFRTLAQAGVYTTNNVNQSRNGITSSTTPTDWTGDLIAAGRVSGSSPSIVVFPIGINDLAGGTCAGQSAAVFETNMKAWITIFYEMGARRLVLYKPHHPGAQTSPDLNGATCDQKALDMSTAVDNLLTWTVAQGYGSKFARAADGYTAFGEDTPDTNLFQSNNIHFNLEGSKLFGEILGAAALAE